MWHRWRAITVMKTTAAVLLGVVIGTSTTILALLFNVTTLHSSSRYTNFVDLSHSSVSKQSNADQKKYLHLTKLEVDAKDVVTEKETVRPPECYDVEGPNVTSSELFEKVKIVCWILTSPKTLYTKAVHIRATWGKRCNKIIYMSSTFDEDFPAVGLKVDEGRENLYEKTKEAFRYVWKNHQNDGDWFLKADDDTFVIMENLRFMLKDFDAYKPMYFGRKFEYKKQHVTYMSGGAGYVLSKAALKRFADALAVRKCQQGSNVEDLEMGRCLQRIGVKAMDSRDEQQTDRFFPLSPHHHLIQGKIPRNSWFWEYIYYPNPSGPNCCSNVAISFHYASADMMYVMDYFIYHLRAFGIDKSSRTMRKPELDKKLNETRKDEEKIAKEKAVL